MKLLSEKKKVYLLLLETFFSFITILIAIAFVNRAETDFLATNIPYQIIGFILIACIYFVIATINKELKYAAILKILKTFINLSLVCFPQILLMNPALITTLKFIVSIIEIPFAYFFYKGFYTLVSQKTNNVVLANGWKKLLTFNIVLAVLNLISHVNNLLDISSISLVSIFALCVSIFSCYIGILKLIYILKTAKEL